ncbi:MAG: ABC transporter substrate-binding protein [Ectothiorhodospiraceae bacterium]|nr:ABC transporter substrate-binding protein [Chromatiales bacterium]MCP5156513.1 ABC transporter substrate-binding protein [Ectothiorhodospiraceae bacterium]
MPITLYESFRAVFYTPFYLVHALDHYRRHGLDVRLGTSPDLAGVAGQLQSGEADVFWGGPMRVMLMRDRDPSCDVVGFAEVVTRDPFFLVGREPRPEFRLTDLATVRVATVSEVPTPWMCLQDDLRRVGIDPSTLDRIDGHTMSENAQALRAGSIDVAQLFQPMVETLLAEGAGHVWYAQASRGPCSYTTLYAMRPWLARNPDTALAMTRAIHDTQRWLHAHDAATIADAVADFFRDCPRPILVRAIARYLELGVWGRDPRLPRVGFERLRGCLLSGGLIGRAIAFEDAVDNSYAEAAVGSTAAD